MDKLELLTALLRQTQQEHEQFCREAQEGMDYYNNKTRAARQGTGQGAGLRNDPLHRANNRISTNWHRVLVDQKVGYLFSYPPMVYGQGDLGRRAARLVEKNLGERFGSILRRLAVDAANCGRGWLAYWVDGQGRFDCWPVDPREIRAVMDPESLCPRMRYLVRSYGVRLEGGQMATRHELWDEGEVAYFLERPGQQPRPDPGRGVMAHPYGRIPFIAFDNNAEARGDLPLYRPIVDAIDRLLCGFADDIDDLQEIIWVIKNYAGELLETEFDSQGNEVPRQVDLLRRIKAKKWLTVDGEGGVETLRGEIPYEARAQLLQLLTRQLYIAAMAVDPFPEGIGQTSGVYIDFLYSLLELKAGLLENQFRPAIDQWLQALLHSRGLCAGRLQQVWTRNKPRSEPEMVAMLAQTPEGVLSKETMTRMHPMVDDWAQERQRVLQEQAGQPAQA